ncbi:MAG: ABC transporter ATP-binding protein [Nocardioides sp.]|uniref:ABC transporter ATP-binding protein n=1 Tax=Nocardioides sp. TaxID=35761 RepID=UPI0039E4691D
MTSMLRHRRPEVPASTGGGTGSELVLEVTALEATYGTTKVVDGLDLQIRRGELVTLLGPSGCGKTTTLRCVGGLHRASAGSIRLGGELVGDRTTHVRPERRSVNMVFQSYALWPHMTVFQNVAYGLRAQRLPRAEIQRRTEEMLDLVGLGGYGPRSATNLSGGQQQRVVLARGLVTRPNLLLLDEPLSNLDTELRVRMRTEIHTVQRELGLSMLYVTHDRSEALALSDRVVVMRDGIAQQTGTPDELYSAPANRFVAEALGPINVLPAVVVAEGAGAAATIQGAAGAPSFPIRESNGASRARVGDPIDLLVRPESLTIAAAEEGGLEAEVELVEFLGNHTEVTCRVGGLRFVVNLGQRPRGLTRGGRVGVLVDRRADLPAWQPRPSGAGDLEES